MTSLPHVATQDRVVDAVLIIILGIAQAAALAVAAFATRDAFAALHSDTVLAVATMVELAGAGLIAAMCLLLSRRRAEALGQSYAIALRRALYTQIARLPKGRHEQRRVGALSLRFVGDLSAARLWFGRGLPDSLTALAVLPGAVAILVSLDPGLAAMGLAPLGLAIAGMGGVAWHLERRHRTVRSRRANIAISMIERIAVAPELDQLGRTSKEVRALDAHGASLRTAAIARRGRTASLQTILQIGVSLSALAMLWSASRSGTAPAIVAASLSVLALVALPLQDAGAAWDRYCAWRIAREKARHLFQETTVRRRVRHAAVPVTVTLRGKYNGEPVDFTAKGGTVTSLPGPYSKQLASCISGLDPRCDVDVLFDGHRARPRVAYIADSHVGLQGSLRRSATLMSRRRPSDERITDVLTGFGLQDLLSGPRGLDQRLSANGKGLTAAQSLRLDLARAVLGEADVIAIASLRWSAEAKPDALLATVLCHISATVILADPENVYRSTQLQKAN